MNEQPWGGEVLGINILVWGRDLSVARVRPCTAAVVSWRRMGAKGVFVFILRKAVTCPYMSHFT